jgi:hypothetical protein
MERFWRLMLTMLGMVVAAGLGGVFVVLAQEDLDAWFPHWGGALGMFSVGVAVGIISRAYVRTFGSWSPLLVTLGLAGFGWYLVESGKVPGGPSALRWSGALVVGHLLTGFRPRFKDWRRNRRGQRQKREVSRYRRVEQGDRILPDGSAVCLICGPAVNIAAKYVHPRTERERWLRIYGPKLASCPKAHVLHVDHFIDRKWRCHFCNEPLYPDLAD